MAVSEFNSCVKFRNCYWLIASWKLSNSLCCPDKVAIAMHCNFRPPGIVLWSKVIHIHEGYSRWACGWGSQTGRNAPPPQISNNEFPQFYCIGRSSSNCVYEPTRKYLFSQWPESPCTHRCIIFPRTPPTGNFQQLQLFKHKNLLTLFLALTLNLTLTLNRYSFRQFLGV